MTTLVIIHKHLKVMKDINSEKQLIIKEIKDEWLGDANEGNRKSINKLHKLATETTTELSTQLYTHDFHFLMELIQNADDNNYKDTVIPTLEIILQSNRLIIICNEIGFRREDIDAICNVKASGKIFTESERRGYIGEKGIGFKSVFKVCDMPEIYSNGFQFRLFGEKTTQHNLKYVVPEWIDNPTIDIDEKKTTLILPLKKEYQKNEDKENDLSNELSFIEPNILLFLRKIKKLIIIDEVNNQKTEILKEVHKNIVTLTIKRNDKTKPFNQKYLLINHTDRPVPNNLIENKRAGIKFSDITLGFPLTESDKPEILESNKVYTFLPIKNYGLKFLINADFLLTSSREDIIDNAWNKWLRREIFEAFKIAIMQFKKDINFKHYFLKYLSDPENISNGFFKQLTTDILNYCKEEPVFPTTIHNKWTTINNIIKYDSKDVQFINKETLEQEIPKYFISKEAHGNYQDKVYNLFNIEPIKLEYIAKCLNNPKWIEKYNHKKLLGFYIYLQDKFKQKYYFLKDKKIIKLKNGDFKSVSDCKIFLEIPTKGKRRYSFENRLNIIHSDFTKEDISLQHLFNGLGINKAKAEIIILEHILPLFNSKLQNSTIVSFTKYIKEHIDKFGEDEINKIRSEIKIITKSGDIVNIKKNKTFFPISYNPEYNMEFFLKELSGNIFLSNEYLKNQESTIGWIKFFKKLGVCEFPIPYYEKDGNSDIVSCWQIEKILQSESYERYSILIEILEKEWETFKKFLYDIQYTNHHRSKESYRKCSKWMKLRDIKILNIKNKWYKPSEVYLLPSKMADLFENKLTILNDEQYSNENFLEVIGVKFKVENEKYIELLKGYEKTEEVEISNIKEIYRQINSNLKLDNTSTYYQQRVKNEFEKYPLIYKNGKWYKSSEVIWKTPPKVFKENYTHLASIYSSESMKSFFVEGLGVKEEIRVDDSYNILLEFEGKTINSESKKIIEILYAKIDFDDIEDEKERTEKINRLKDCKLWLNQTNQLCNSGEVYFVEDDNLYEEFKDEAIYLYGVSSINNKGYIPKIKRFFKQLGIYPSFENALSLKIDNFAKQPFSEKWEKKLKKALPIAIEYIHEKEEPKVIDHLSKGMVFKKLSKTKVIVLEEIQARHTINQISKSKKVDSLFDKSKNILFIKDSDDEIIQSLLAEELGKYLKIDGLDDFIDRIFLSKSNSNSERIYSKKNIKHIQKEELVQLILGQKQDVSLDMIQDLLGIEETEDITKHELAKKTPKTQKHTSPKVNNDDTTTTNFNLEIEDDLSEEEEEFEYIDKKFDIPPFAVPIETKNYDLKDDAYSTTAKKVFPNAQQRTLGLHHRQSNYQPTTTGNWGEYAVFLSLIDELEQKYDAFTNEFISDKLFVIKNDNDEEIVRLEWLNQDGKEAASRDIELIENENKILIEVKSSIDEYSTTFKVTHSQWKALKKEKDNYWIFRVLGVGKDNYRIEKIINPFKEIINGKISIISKSLDLEI